MSSNHKKQTMSSVQHEDLKEAELASNGKWAAGITLMCYCYGNMTVANFLPKDPRQNSWIMTQSPIPTLFFSLVYVAVVTWFGPRFMRHREPIKGLRYPMMLYNAFQVIFNFYMFLEVGLVGWFGTYSLFCEPCNFTNQTNAIRMMHVVYWYYISKMLDFLDTIFFVAHKKFDHISLLHVSHHALMPISTWFGVRYQPGGHNTFMGFLNTFIHVLMYLYYLLAAMGPRVRPYLWWKKYLTTIQMIQFIAMFIHAMTTLLFLNCNIPHAFARWVGGMAFVFQILFTDFYIKAYRKKGFKFQVCKLDNDLLLKRNYTGMGENPNLGTHTGAISKFVSTSTEKNGDIVGDVSLRNRIPVS